MYLHISDVCMHSVLGWLAEGDMLSFSFSSFKSLCLVASPFSLSRNCSIPRSFKPWWSAMKTMTSTSLKKWGVLLLVVGLHWSCWFDAIFEFLVIWLMNSLRRPVGYVGFLWPCPEMCRPNITVMVDWALKINYLSILRFVCLCSLSQFCLSCSLSCYIDSWERSLKLCMMKTSIKLYMFILVLFLMTLMQF